MPVMKNGKGFTLVETLVAVAILGIVSVALLSGFNTASLGGAIVDERETANNVAESQMECVKGQAYALSYAPSTPLSNEYARYSVNITTSNITARDGNIQKITVTVKHGDKEVTRLEGYKVN
jgi:prepilin-type N-terminal cleavage/methylation domain-containing protein